MVRSLVAPTRGAGGFPNMQCVRFSLVKVPGAMSRMIRFEKIAVTHSSAILIIRGAEILARCFNK